MFNPSILIREVLRLREKKKKRRRRRKEKKKKRRLIGQEERSPGRGGNTAGRLFGYFVSYLFGSCRVPVGLPHEKTDYEAVALLNW